MNEPNRWTDLDAWRLDRDWDDLVLGNRMPSESPMTRAIQRFQADGETEAPAVGFVTRLEEKLLDSLGTPAATATVQPAALPPVATRPAPEAARRSRWSWPVLDIAAMLLLVAGIIAFVAMQNDLFPLPWRDGKSDQPIQQISGGPAMSGLPLAAATPAATPAPTECIFPPRTIEEVISIVGIADRRQWDEPYYRSFPPNRSLAVLPTGKPAPPSIIAEIQFTLDQLLACSPVETYLSGTRFSSEAAIRRDLNRPLTSDIIAGLQDPSGVPQPPVFPTRIEIERAEVLEDGRVVVDAVPVFPADSGNAPSEALGTIIFVREDGLWRFDEDANMGASDPFEAATPGTGFVQEPRVPNGTPPAAG